MVEHTAFSHPRTRPSAGLVGEWEGAGWLQYEGMERANFNAREVIESRLGGLVLVLEGMATASDESKVIFHHGFSILTYAAPSSRFVMLTIRQDGSNAIAEVEQDAGFLEWSLEDPVLGAVKHTLRLTQSGLLFAVGDHSEDGGATFRRFYEMELTRRM